MSDSIKVGDGATYGIGSDRYPFTVVEVVSPRKLVVQRDNYRRTDSNGISEKQIYEYTADQEGSKRTITKRKDGHWCELGMGVHGNGRYSIGHRNAYQDPCF